MPDRVTPLRAAGGVVWRERRRRIEVLVVHRPNRLDWSLPKGKPDKGENALQTAVREVLEETGLPFTVGPFLRQVRYPWLESEKRVDYWSMRLHEDSDGEPMPMDADEIDGHAWLGYADARERLSYPTDVDVLEEFTRIGTVPIRLLLVRHGSAGDRSGWKGPDDRRPLDSTGLLQAAAIGSTLGAFGPSALFAARPQRCPQTLQPLAKHTGLKIKQVPELSEADFRNKPQAGLQTLRSLLEKPDTSVVCSQGGVIPGAVDTLVPDRRGRKSKSRKGSVWALGVREGRITTVDHYASLYKQP